MESIKLSLKEYFNNKLSQILQKSTLLYLFGLIWVAIVISNLIVRNFQKTYEVAHNLNLFGAVAVFLPIYSLSLIGILITIALILPIKIRALLKQALNKICLYPTIRKAEIFISILSYFYCQAASAFIIVGIGRVARFFTLSGFAYISLLSVALIFFILVMGIISILILCLIHIISLFGINQVRVFIPLIFKNAANIFIDVVSPTLIYKDFIIAWLLTIPIVIMMNYFHIDESYMIFFEKNYFDFMFLLYLSGSFFIVGLEKLKPAIYKDYADIIYRYIGCIQQILRGFNFILMLFILPYCTLLFLRISPNFDYWTDLFSKIVGLMIFTSLFEFFANMLQPILKSIHDRKTVYKSPKNKK